MLFRSKIGDTRAERDGNGTGFRFNAQRRDILSEPFIDARNEFYGDIGEKNNEFFSAKTAAEIRIANALLNFSGKFFKSEIADSMSVRIVDSFEMVKVEKKKSACMPSVRGEIDCVEKFFLKGVPVIIICQRVMRRNLFKCLGGLVKFMYGRTDVFDNGLKRA